MLARAEANSEEDTIIFSSGLISPQLTSELVIRSPQKVTIQGRGLSFYTSKDVPSRYFHVMPGAAAELHDLVLRGGGVVGANGGAILNEGSLTLNDAKIIDCFARDDNSGTGFGGAIFNSGDISIDCVVIDANSALTGGGLANTGTARVNRAEFNENRATLFGGGVWNGGKLNLDESEFYNNSAANNGGGLANIAAGELIVRNSTFYYNSTGRNGGAIDSQTDAGFAVIVNSTITLNRAGQSGGGIHNSAGQLLLVNDTFVRNVADSDGNGTGLGGGLLGGANESVYNTIFAGNYLATEQTPYDVESEFEAGGHNLIQDPLHAAFLQDGVDGNLIGVDPQIDVDLGVTGNGMPGHLLVPTSPAIDAGDNAIAMANNLKADQRGFQRYRFGKVDIGAHEAQPNVSFINGTLRVVETNASFHLVVAKRSGSQFVLMDRFSRFLLPDGTAVKSYAVPLAAVKKFSTSKISEIRFDHVAGGSFDMPRGISVADANVISIHADADISVGGKRIAVQGHTPIAFNGTPRTIIQGGRRDNRLSTKSYAGLSILIGGGGSDTLIAGLGQSMLIGGTGRDVLIGGPQQDILIGGEQRLGLAYEVLNWTFSYWVSNGTYNEKIDLLKSFEHEPWRYDASKFPNDNARDTLLGGGSLDWFWAFAGDSLDDRRANERLR